MVKPSSHRRWLDEAPMSRMMRDLRLRKRAGNGICGEVRPGPDQDPVRERVGRPQHRPADEAEDYSLLGLGDIVVPGLFAALLLRFDASRAQADQSQGEHGRFAKPFFHACLVAYVLGLAATVAVMFYFEAAQPALFYLVPACLGATGLTAGWRKEVKALMAYDENTEENASESNDDQGQAAVVAAKKSD